jgi:vancomycin resistance protein VanJ
MSTMLLDSFVFRLNNLPLLPTHLGTGTIPAMTTAPQPRPRYRLWLLPFDAYLILMVIYGLLRLILGYALWPIRLLSEFLHLILPISISVLLVLILLRQKWRMFPASVLTAAWLMLFGLPLIQRQVQHSPECANCKSIRVITYNLGAGLADPQRTADLLRDSGADIIGLQELTLDQMVVLQNQLSDLYPYEHVHPTAPSLALFSKYPITEVEEWFGPRDFNAKYLRFKLDVNEHPLNVIVMRFKTPRLEIDAANGHFDYYTWPNADDLAAIAPEIHPAVLLLDMNGTDQSENYQTLSRVGFHDAFFMVGSNYGATFPARSDGWHQFPINIPPLVRIDYILFSDEIIPVTAQTLPATGSDHLPVMADLLLP